MKYQIIVLLGALGLFQLSGCATLMDNDSDQVPVQSANPTDLNHWKITGKLAVRNQQKAQSINFIWHQKNTDYSLTLNGPLGFGSASIDGNLQQATVRQGSLTYSGSPDQLATELLGVPLSVEAMSWWLRGLASPNHAKATNQVMQQGGLISSLRQNGWQLQFLDYQASGKFMMPKKISGRRGELYFKLVINQWDIPH